MTLSEFEFYEQDNAGYVKATIPSYISQSMTKSIMDRLNSFMEDYPDTNQVIISCPSFKRPGTFLQKGIYPVMREYRGKKFVEFTFAE